MKNKYHITNYQIYDVTLENLYIQKSLLSDLTNFLSNYGVNLISPFLIKKNELQYSIIYSILEQNGDNYNQNLMVEYIECENYLVENLEFDDYITIIEKEENALIEITKNEIKVMKGIEWQI